MKNTEISDRKSLIRESFVFQLKLLVDGTRDFILVPVSLIATLVGLIRGGDDPAVEFRRVLELGRQSERWIDLFGQHEPLQDAGEVGSMDILLARAEAVVKEQAREGKVSENASKALEKALDSTRRKGRAPKPGTEEPEN